MDHDGGAMLEIGGGTEEAVVGMGGGHDDS